MHRISCKALGRSSLDCKTEEKTHTTPWVSMLMIVVLNKSSCSQSGEFADTGAVVSGLLLNHTAENRGDGWDQSHPWILQALLPIIWDLSVIEFSAIFSSSLILGTAQFRVRHRVRHRLLNLQLISRSIRWWWWWRRWWGWRRRSLRCVCTYSKHMLAATPDT